MVFALPNFHETLSNQHTIIDHTNGHIDLKKRELLLNTYNTVIIYLMHCNTDISSLLSGTAVKAIAYVTDYITKQNLKTHHIFQSALDILNTYHEQKDQNDSASDKARQIVLKIINSLMTKMEIGGPFACLYLLEHPDHYTSHCFINFRWTSCVSYMKTEWEATAIAISVNNEPIEDNNSGNTNGTPNDEDLIGVLAKNEQGYFLQQETNDYVYRPKIYEEVSLYRWIQCATKITRKKKDIDELKKKTPDQAARTKTVAIGTNANIF